MFSKSLVPAAAVLALVGTAGPAQAAFSTGFSTMVLGNLQVSFDDPNASLAWADSWYGLVGAGVWDSETPEDTLFNDTIGDNAEIDLAVGGAYSLAGSFYQVSDGASVAIGNGEVLAETLAFYELDGKYLFAEAFGSAGFDNFFTIEGGAIGELVSMTLSIDYDGFLAAVADQDSFFRIDALAFLGLYDDQDGNWSNLLAFDQAFDQAFGSGTDYDNFLFGTLTFTSQVAYGELYRLYGEAYAGAGGEVPVPATLPLLLLGAGLMAWGRRRV